MSPEPLASLDSQPSDQVRGVGHDRRCHRRGYSEVGTVFVPVSDQDRSLEFFVGKLGFAKRADRRSGGQARHDGSGRGATFALMPLALSLSRGSSRGSTLAGRQRGAVDELQERQETHQARLM
jgi:hypothetical protein